MVKVTYGCTLMSVDFEYDWTLAEVEKQTEKKVVTQKMFKVV